MQEDRDAIHRQRAREAVHHRREQRVQIRLGAEFASEFDQCAPIVIDRAVEKMVDPVLNPFPNRIKQQGSDYNREDPSHRTSAWLPAVNQRRHTRDQSEVQTHDGCGRERINNASLEDQIHIHQAVAEDGVAKGQWQHHQRKY